MKIKKITLYAYYIFNLIPEEVRSNFTCFYFKDVETNWYEKPKNVVGVLVNPITGELATDGDEKNKTFYFIKGTEPYSNDNTQNLDTAFKEKNMQ